MRLALSLHHWQLFVILTGIPVVTAFIPLENVSPSIVIYSSIAFAALFLGWIFALGIELAALLPADKRVTTTSFRLHCLYIVVVFAVSGLFQSLIKAYPGLYLLSVIYALVSFVVAFRFIGKVLATLELGRQASAADYVGTIFLLWFFPIGVWFIQPKVQRLARQNGVAA
jgi:hypothetical protein